MRPSPLLEGDTQVASSLDLVTGRPGSFPVRALNSRLFGAPDSGLPSLGGCGRPISSTRWVPVFAVVDRWRPALLASCQSRVACDHCTPRQTWESRQRFAWHFGEWLEGGGRLAHLRLSVPHTLSDDLPELLDGLGAAARHFRKSSAWQELVIPGYWVTRLHVRWGEEHGWHPHLHGQVFLKPGASLDVDALQMSWRSAVGRLKGRAASKNGLFARITENLADALYAWGDSDEVGRWEPKHSFDDNSAVWDSGSEWEPGGWGHEDDDEGGSWSTWALAGSAIAGNRHHYRLWEHFCTSMHGRPVVSKGRLVDELWAKHGPTPGVLDAGQVPDPVLQVSSSLWEMARRRACTDVGLEVGRVDGLEALSGFWSREVGRRVVLARSGGGVPLMWVEGDQPAPGESLVNVFDLDYLTEGAVS